MNTLGKRKIEKEELDISNSKKNKVEKEELDISSSSKEVKKELVVAGITIGDELVYKKDKDWFYGNGKKYTLNKEKNGKPNLVKDKKYAIDIVDLIVYDYDSVKKNTPIKIGKINEIDSKLNNL